MAMRTIKEFDAPGGRFTLAEAREAARALLLEASKRPAKKTPGKKTATAKRDTKASKTVAAKSVKKPAAKKV